ncbi:MAG: hypothetical protein WA738_17650 [Candidatus Angelobacter sp.]
MTSAFAQSPPTLTKAFSAATVGLNSSTTLTFTVTNPNPATDLTGIGFNDNLPSGLIIANPDSLVGSCDTSVITLGVNSLSMSGAIILANSSCSFSIDVLAVATGDQVNITDNITSVEGGTGGTATATVTVTAPDLTITETHTGNFARPQLGAIYTITVTNSGPADTTNLVTVTDALPAGLTATAIDGGVNWNCTVSPNLQCSRGDVLLAGTSYEPITLTVNVAANAPSSVTNTAAVSGGGETNTANDTASDVTQIVAALQLTAPSGALQVAAGGTASTTVNVNYNGGLGAITFACTGLPALATCSFNPASVSAAGITPVTLNISTTARAMVVMPQGPGRIPPNVPALLAFLGLTAMALSLTRSRKFRLRLLSGGIGAILLLLAGCGGGSSSSKTVQGTPAGTSAVVVTATSATGGATATSTINLTVQ